MEASVAIQSLPAVADDDELCRIVDEVIAYIASSGYNYFVGPFETTIEGPYDELMEIVKECQHIAIRAGAPAVAAYVKISYKPEGEVLSIERKIGKSQFSACAYCFGRSSVRRASSRPTCFRPRAM